ncbi:alpha/beta hydrolase [Lachnospiraceae bacterium ZAX-1]
MMKKWNKNVRQNISTRNKATKRQQAVAKRQAECDISIRALVIRRLIARFTADNLLGQKIQTGELRKKMVEPKWKCPELFHNTVIELPAFTMEYLSRKENPRLDKVILQLHGGGYIGPMRNAYRTFAGLYNEVSKGMSVLTIDYRVAPEYPYPAALEDAKVAYDWLLQEEWKEEQIIVVGDSAGGGLALALCMYLKDKKYSLPGGLIIMSPWADVTCSGPSYEDNYESDPLFGNTKVSMLYSKDYVQSHNPANPYISPAFGNFKGFPPMLIQVGSVEMLLSDSVLVAHKAKLAGVKVRLSIYEGMFHIFQMAMRMMPESTKAWTEIGKYFEVLDTL